MAAKEKHCQLKKTTFSDPLAGPTGGGEVIATKMWDAVSGTDMCVCVCVLVQRFSQICSAVYEEMHPKQTDRQTDKQTDTQTAKLNIPHYHGWDNDIISTKFAYNMARFPMLMKYEKIQLTVTLLYSTQNQLLKSRQKKPSKQANCLVW